MPPIFQAVGSYGLHEGMRKEVSASACRECVEGMSLMQTKWPERLPNHSGHWEGRKKLWWEKCESRWLTKAWCRSLRWQWGGGQRPWGCLYGITSLPPKKLLFADVPQWRAWYGQPVGQMRPAGELRRPYVGLKFPFTCTDLGKCRRCRCQDCGWLSRARSPLGSPEPRFGPKGRGEKNV